MEHAPSSRASPRHGDVCRLPGPLSHRVGPWMAGRGRVLGLGAASVRARRLDGVERGAATSPSAPCRVPEPVSDPPRGALPSPRKPCAGPYAAPPGGRFRGPLRLSPVAGGDVCRARPGRGLLQGGELRVRRAHGGARAPGPPQGLCTDGEVGVHVRVGGALAPAPGGAVCRCGAVARTGRGSGQRRVGGERVWRSPVGRQAVVGAPGEERGAAGLVSGACDDRQPDPRPGGGEGLLPVGRQARRIAGDAFEHSGAAPRAHYRADARPGDGSMHPGRDGPELRDPARLRWPGHHRAQPDVLKEPWSASASDLGGERRGPALGVLRCDFDAPPEREDDSEGARGDGTGAPGDGDDAITERGAGPGEDANHREKKTQRWLDGLHDVAAAASELSRKTRVVSVMDREADFFELFDEQRRLHRTEMLVRAKHDRCLGKGASKLFATMRNAEPCGHVEIEIDRVSERRKSSRKKARPARSKRLALAEVHYRKLVVPATIKGAEPAPVSVVHVRETAPPDGEEAVEWFLLTSLDVDSFEAAVSIIGYYLKRWRIEDFFRVLKSGCRAEHLAFHTAERLQRAITINAVIAWRLMLMTLLGREVPQCAAELMFTDIELRFLADYAANNHLPAPQHLGAAVLLVAILGGYQNRKHDPPPGHQIMWRGYERMSIATLGYRLAEKRREGAGIVQNE